MKVALVTGASRRIGAAIAERLAADGLRVVGVSRTPAESAGVEHEGTVVDTTAEEWDHVMAVNLRSVFLCSKYAIPHLSRTCPDDASFATGQAFVLDGGLTAGRAPAAEGSGT